MVRKPGSTFRLTVIWIYIRELCGSSFWVRFNQRFHRLRPTQEVYSQEIERSLFNVVLANQGRNKGVRYFAQLVGSKTNPTSISTCCESQLSQATWTF